ncbi:MAG: hypothetical protein ACOYB3_13125 [Azonexus sp.]
MATQATVSLIKNVFVATLGDGRRIKHADLRKMAYALLRAGVLSSDVKFEWHAGLRMITAGQQVSLSAEMTRLERERPNLTIAA